MSGSLGQVVFAFFEDHLKIQKGLRPPSIRSYRDTIKLFLIHVAPLRRRSVTRLSLSDLTFERVLDFLPRLRNSVETSHARETSGLPLCARSIVTSPFITQKCWPKLREWKPFRPNVPRLRKPSTWNAMRSMRSFRPCPEMVRWRCGIAHS